MTPTELRARLAALGLTQRGLALRLGVSSRAVRHWCAGSREIPQDIARRVMLYQREN